VELTSQTELVAWVVVAMPHKPIKLLEVMELQT
jgi:hypothetical protein